LGVSGCLWGGSCRFQAALSIKWVWRGGKWCAVRTLRQTMGVAGSLKQAETASGRQPETAAAGCAPRTKTAFAAFRLLCPAG